MKNNFNNCVNLVLQSEGGYSNTPGDNGGPTNFGITLTDYRKYIKKTGTASDVKSMTKDQAVSIYKGKYWDALGCDDLASGVDYTCFDYGVNSGVGRPRKVLQRFKSLSGTKLIDAINDERLAFLKHLAATEEHDEQFLDGWVARVARVRAYSKKLATNTIAGPAAGAGTLGIGASIAQYWHQHEFLIISITIALAVAAGVAIHYYRNKK